MSEMTVSKANKLASFQTPALDSPLWFEDPKWEDREDKKTPVRRRTTHGNYYVLIEWVEYKTFPSPEARAAAKARGEKAKPFYHAQYRIHFRHSTREQAFTYYIYKHQGQMRYDDSTNHSVRLASKTMPPTDALAGRLALVKDIQRMHEDRTTTIEQASHLLGQWTNGN